MKLDAVIDGDTLRLQNGRKVRVIAINTPELAYRGRPHQPLATEAREAAVAFFSGTQRVGLRLGADAEDRYGRILAHVYREDGASLSAHLLSQGLAWHVVVTPNVFNWPCYQGLERKATEGIWAVPAYKVTTPDQLLVSGGGFQRIRGKVSSVARSRDSWWVNLSGLNGQLAIRLRDRDSVYFGEQDPQDWQGQQLTIRGWVIDRRSRQSDAMKAKGFAPFMINLYHPGMLDFDSLK